MPPFALVPVRLAATLRVPRLLSTAVALALAVAAAAGPAFADEPVAIQGYDPVAYFTPGQAVKGSPEFTFRYHDATYQFASAANRDTFAADPQKYAPRYDGYCAYGVAKGAKAPVDPQAFSIVDGRLYLNFNQEVRERWLQDPTGYIKRADDRWPEVSRAPTPPR